MMKSMTYSAMALCLCSIFNTTPAFAQSDVLPAQSDEQTLSQEKAELYQDNSDQDNGELDSDSQTKEAQASPPEQTEDDNPPIFDAVEERMKVDESVTPETTDLLGEQIDLNNGQLSFSHVDVSLPGNSALPVRLQRSYRGTAWLNRVEDSWGFADWQLVIPHIKTNIADKRGSQPGTNPWYTQEQCTRATDPGIVPDANLIDLMPADYFSGITLNVPGQVNDLLVSSFAPDLTTLPDSQLVTKSNWQVQCDVLLTQGAQGQGFNVTSPDGVVYTFDKFKKVKKYNPSRVGSTSHYDAYTFVSRIEDRFGNWVVYDFDDQMRLSAIYAKDGRRIDLTYQAANPNLIEFVYVNKTADNERRWQYHYNSEGSRLTNVTLPDETSQWTFNLQNIHSTHYLRENFANNNQRDTNDICEHINQNPAQYPEKTVSITHPNGTTGTFAVQLLSFDRANVTSHYSVNNTQNPQWDKPYCSYNFAIKSKVLSGPGLTDMSWQYQYAQHRGNYHQVATNSNPEQMRYIGADGKVSTENTPGAHNQFTIAGKTLPSLVAAASHHYRYTQVTAPDNSQTIHFFDRNFHNATENREVATDYYDTDGTTLLQRHTTTYRAESFSGEHGIFSYNNMSVTDNLKPQTHRVDPILQKTVHYTADNAQDTFVIETLDFNDYGVATDRIEYQGTSVATAVKKRYTRQGFRHDTDKWVLNQPTTQHLGTSATDLVRVSEITYHTASTAGGAYQSLSLPYEQKGYGDWQQRFTAYHANGQVQTVEYNQVLKTENGSDSTTHRSVSYSNYHRGQPQTITLPARYNDVAVNRFSTSQIIDDNGWVTSTTDAKGFTTQYHYDDLGRLVAIERHDDDNQWLGTHIDWQQAAGEGPKRITRQCSLINTNDNDSDTIDCGQNVPLTEETRYDALLRPVLSITQDTSQQNSSSRYQYQQFNPYNKPTFTAYPTAAELTVDSNTPGIRYSYDGLQRLKATSQSGGGTVAHRYLSDNTIEVTDAKNHVTTTQFLAYGQPSYEQPLRINSANIVITTLDINVYGDLTEIRQAPPATEEVPDPVAQVEYRAYDAAHRLCKITRSDVGTTVFDRNILGEIQWQAQGVTSGSATDCHSTTANSDKTHFVYDNLGDIWHINYGDQTTPNLSHQRDNNGNLTHITSTEFNQVYQYNSLNLLEDETLNIPADNKSFTLDYGYNGQGFLSSIQYPDGDGAVNYAPNGYGQPTQAIKTYSDNAQGIFAEQGAEYYPNGLLKSFHYGNGIQYETTLNSRQMPEHATDSKGGTKVLDLTYSYDFNNNITAIVNPRESGLYSLTNLTYDGLDRLKTTTGGDGIGDTTLTYDHLGNIKTYSNTSLFNQHDLTYQYGAHGRLKKVTGIGSEGYDFEQLSESETADEYHSYDGRGNVIHNGKRDFVYNLANQMTASGTNRYLYDGHNRRIKTIDSKGTSYSLYSQSGTLLYRETTSGGINYVYLGSKLIAKEGTGLVAQSDSRLHYKPFGDTIELPKDDVGYTGHKFDTDLDLNYMQARYYDPVIGRFYGNDPIGYRDVHSFNRYAYANNNPYKYVDPDGRAAFLIPIAIFLLKEGAAEVASSYTGGLSDYLSVRRAGTKFVKYGSGLIRKHSGRTASQRLGKSLTELIGPRPSAEHQAAHIIPTGAFKGRSEDVQKAIASSQAKFDKILGDNFRDTALNGFWAKPGHLGTHTDKYFKELAKALNDVKTEEQLAKAMQKMAKRINNGEFK